MVAQGGRAFDPAEARERLLPLALGAAGVGVLALQLQSTFWRLAVWMAAAAMCSRLVLEVRRARGKADAAGAVQPGGIEGWTARIIPWGAIGLFTWIHELGPRLSSGGAEATSALSIAVWLLLVVVSLFLAVPGRPPRALSSPRASWSAGHRGGCGPPALAAVGKVSPPHLPASPVLALAA